MTNTKITYKWTKDANEWNVETDHIVTDGMYDFSDWLYDNDVAFEHDDSDTYYVLDDNGDRTGEAYMVVSEEPTDEELLG